MAFDFLARFAGGGFFGVAASEGVTLSVTDPEGESLSSVADDVLAGSEFDVMKFQQGSAVSAGDYQVEVTLADENGGEVANTDQGAVEYTLRGVGGTANGTRVNDERTREIESGETQQLTVTMSAISPLPGYENLPPQDLDDDGLYEDVDGDGEFTIFDVQSFFKNFQSETVQSNPEAFNFSGDPDDEVTIFDVQALFQKLAD